MDGNSQNAAAEWLRLVQSISHCGRQLRRAVAELAEPHGLTDTECLILWSCCEAPPEGQGQHELVSLIGVSPAQLSGLVEQLGVKGWIVGRRPAHDRRRQYWRLTPAGQALVDQLLVEVARWLAASAADHDHRALAQQLGRLASSFGPISVRRGKEAA